MFIPARYPGAASDEHRLARRTDWVALNGDLWIGQGQRCLSTNADLTGVLDVRDLCIGV